MKTLFAKIILAIIIAVIIYVLLPKYYFTTGQGMPIFRCNTVTGKTEYIFDDTLKARTSKNEANKNKLNLKPVVSQKIDFQPDKAQPEKFKLDVNKLPNKPKNNSVVSTE